MKTLHSNGLHCDDAPQGAASPFRLLCTMILSLIGMSLAMIALGIVELNPMVKQQLIKMTSKSTSSASSTLTISATIAKDNETSNVATSHPVTAEKSHKTKNNDNKITAQPVSSRNRLDELPPFDLQRVVSMEEVMELFPAAFTPQNFWDRRNNYTPSTPFLNLGMPKAGSLSIHDFLNCTGYKTSHYRSFTDGDRIDGSKSFVGECMNTMFWGRNWVQRDPPEHYFVGTNLANLIQQNNGTFIGGSKDQNHSNPQLLRNCDMRNNFDGHSQMDRSVGDYGFCSFPQHEFLEVLLDESPNATLFLPFRSFEPWIDSTRRWRSSMLKYINKDCPYAGLDAFDSNLTRHTKNVAFWTERQKRQQQLLLEQVTNPNKKWSQEGSDTFQALSQLRGNSTEANIALFWVYHVTYAREVVDNVYPSATLIEYQLEDDSTGELLSKLFHDPYNDTFSCWEHTHQNPK